MKKIISVSFLSVVFAVSFAITDCSDDPALSKPKIEKIVFSDNEKTVFAGDVVQVGITVEPKEARQYETVDFAVSSPGIIEIKKDSGNDGVVFEALQPGTVIITAKKNGAVDFCSITVKGSDDRVVPHIIVPSYVLELRENERRSISATLAGGTPMDNAGFVWTHTNQKSVQLVSTGNVGVIDTLEAGDSVVTISHPKAAYNIEVLVFVLGSNEMPVYISTDSNVINLNKGDDDFQFKVELKGGNNDDTRGFVYEVVEGRNVIDVMGNNDVGVISIKEKGVAKVGISHIKAKYRLDIVVLVNESTVYSYIDVSQTLLILNKGESSNLTFDMVGDVPADYIDNFSYEVNNDESIDIISSKNLLFITGINSGKTIISIDNKYADLKKPILVIVNEDAHITDNEIFITTDQNIITMEAGGPDAVLNMMLAGGIEADRNNFTWTVDDSSVIAVESADGRVEYSDLRNRAMTGNLGSKLETQAVIKAKKVGTAKITLENPKAKNSCTVIVKVYKKGTFGALPAVLSGRPFYQIEHGGQLSIDLGIVSGSIGSAGNLTWEIEDVSVAAVDGAGLVGVITARSSGITTLRVSGSNLKYDFTSVIMVGSEEYLKNGKFIYVHNPHMSIIKDNSIAFKVMCENMSNADIDTISVINNNPDIVNVFAYRNSVNVTGLQFGTAELIISADDANTIRVLVNVEDYNINPDKPFYLRSNETIKGFVRGNNTEIEVDLVGGGEIHQNNIIWKIDNSNIASLSGNGRRAVVKGLAIGQTTITVSHPKSSNNLILVIYVVENEAALQNTVVLYAPENNMLLRLGEEKYITIITNANSVQRNSINWNIGDAGITSVNVSSDKVKALIKGINIGNTNISVTSSLNSLPVNIYVSVIDSVYNQKYINVPSVIEGIAGDTVTINALCEGILDPWNISWSVSDTQTALLHENGDMCMVNMLRKGMASIRVEYKETGFLKEILLAVYGSASEMASSYVMGSEQSRYVINKGDIINIGLVFGIKGYPEHEMMNIQWRDSGNNVLEVTGNGKRSIVKGVKAGIGYVLVNGISNGLEIEVEVRETGGISGRYWFGIAEPDRIKGLVVNDFADINIRVYNDNNVLVDNIQNINYVVENTSIVTVLDNGTAIRITAKNVGQSYITLKHDLIEEARILIYVAANSDDLNNAYPVMADSGNYLLQKGESRNIIIRTVDNDIQKLNNIHYELEQNSGIINIREKDKREIIVTARERGNDVILIKYNNSVVQKIYVSVTEYEYNTNGSFLITEQIVGMVVGQTYTAMANTNYNGLLSWYSVDSTVAAVDEIGYVDKTAELYGNSVGRTNVIVRAGNIERYLLVVVCANQQDLENLKAINMEQRYYQIYKGDSLTINIASNTGVVEGTTVYSDYYGNSAEFGNVIGVNGADNSKLSVLGLNEGVAAVRVSNSFYNADIVIYIEVNSKRDGFISGGDNNSYLTSNKTLYLIGLDETDISMNVSITGSYVGNGVWTWDGYDKSKIEVSYNGSMAVVNPKREGETTIAVTYSECSGSLYITVIVGGRFVIENGGQPYIYAEKDVYEVQRDSGDLFIDFSVVNVGNYSFNNVSVVNESAGNITASKYADERIRVRYNDAGLSRFEIKYVDLQEGIHLSKEIYVIVKEKIIVDNIYLTTSENFIITTVNSIRQLNVTLVGYDEINGNNFEWSTNNSSIVKVVGNGSIGQLYGMAVGEAIITVKHKEAPYPLQINVKVVLDNVAEKAVYLTTQMNVVETVVSDGSGYLYVQKIGGNANRSICTWEVDNASIISISGQGYSAIYTAKKAGIAKVTVRNEESSYKLTIVVIVKNAVNSNMYIHANSSLVMIAPGSSEYVSVSLVNGEEKDHAKFVWSIYYQNPVNPNVAVSGGNVVSIFGSGEKYRVDALNEGTARLRVSHEKADLPLYITIYVTAHKEINFSVSQKEIITGNSDFVAINVPTYEYLYDKVHVYSDNIDVCDVVYTNSTALLIGKNKGAATIKARIEGKEGEAELYVTVVDDIDLNASRIAISKTMYSLSTKSSPVRLTAMVVGFNAFDSDNENIEWELRSLSPGMESSDVLRVFPIVQKGREIQIVPAGKEGQVIVTVKHSRVEEKYWKNILVIVNNSNDRFSLDKNAIQMNSTGGTVTLKANIQGGTTKDYEQIVWVAKKQAKWDGTYVEIVRIMGNGREVSLFPMRDGTTEVVAYYGNAVPQYCEVTVISDYFFDFNVGNITLPPGYSRDLSFELRPASANVNWIISDGSGEGEGPVITTAEIFGSPTDDKSVQRYMRVTALREGTASITGITNNRVSTVQIRVKEDYRFLMDFPEAGYYPKEPVYSNKDSNGNVIVENGKRMESDGKSRLDFTVYPANTYIKVDDEANYPGLQIDIYHNYNTGEGYVEFTGRQELSYSVIFKQYKYRQSISAEEIPTGNTATRNDITYAYREKIKPVPYFVRYDGYWSNREYRDKGHTFLQSGMENYEMIKESAASNDGNWQYDLTIGDGENHYIFFDKKYENAVLDINTTSNWISPAGYEYALQYRIDKVDLNGKNEAALVINGSGDYVEYNRVMFNKSLYIDVQSHSVVKETSSNSPPLFDRTLHFKVPVTTTVLSEDAIDLWDNVTIAGADIVYHYSYSKYFLYEDLFAAAGVTAQTRDFTLVNKPVSLPQRSYIREYKMTTIYCYDEAFLKTNNFLEHKNSGTYFLAYYTLYLDADKTIKAAHNYLEPGVLSDYWDVNVGRVYILTVLNETYEFNWKGAPALGNWLYQHKKNDDPNDTIYCDYDGKEFDMSKITGNEVFLSSNPYYSVRTRLTRGSDVTASYNVFKAKYEDDDVNKTRISIIKNGLCGVKEDPKPLITNDTARSSQGITYKKWKLGGAHFDKHSYNIPLYYVEYANTYSDAYNKIKVDNVNVNILGAVGTAGNTYTLGAIQWDWWYNGNSDFAWDGVDSGYRITNNTDGFTVRNKVQWRDTANVVVPTYMMNYWPLRYGSAGASTTLVSFDKTGDSSVTLRPMPSINTNTRRIMTVQIPVTYRIKNEGRTETKILYINVKYEVRPSHHLYEGNDKNINDTSANYMNVSGVQEYPGLVVSWDDMYKENDAFAPKDNGFRFISKDEAERQKDIPAALRYFWQ